MRDALIGPALPAALTLLLAAAGCTGTVEQAYRSALGAPTYEVRYDPATDRTTHLAGPFVLSALTAGAPALSLSAATSCPGQAACVPEAIHVSLRTLEKGQASLQPKSLYILAGGLRFYVPDPIASEDVRAAVPAADFRALMGLAGDWTIHVDRYDYVLQAAEQGPLRQLAARVR